MCGTKEEHHRKENIFHAQNLQEQKNELQTEIEKEIK